MTIPSVAPAAESPAERVSTPVDGVDVLGGDVTVDDLDFRCHDGHIRSAR